MIKRRKRPEFWTESFTWVMQRRKTKVTQRSDEGGSVLWPELVNMGCISFSNVGFTWDRETTDRNTRFTWVLGCKTKQIPESFPDIRYSSTKGRKTYPNFPKFPSRMPSNFQYEIQHRQQPPLFLVSERYFTNFRSTPPSSGNVPNKRVSHFWPSSSGVKVWWDNPQLWKRDFGP